VSLWETIRADLEAPVRRDPANHGHLDVILSYPGFHALTAHRFIHPLYRRGLHVPAKFLAYLVRFYTGIEIHPGATIGKGVFIDHGMGVVIGETAEVGDDALINQGVTLGGTSTERIKRHPTLGKGVIVGADALVIGAITVGDYAKVGAGSVVVKDVPPNATVVGIPARVVLQDGLPVRSTTPSVPRLELPDPNAQLIAQLSERVAALERRLAQLQRYDDVSPSI